MVCRGADGQRYVVKLPCTAEGVQSLRRQAGVLTALHGDGRLGGWRAVVPRSLGEGEVDGYRYWVEEALPGIPATAALRRGRATDLLDAAMRLIGDLHARTSACRVLDEATVQAWVDGPIRRLEEFCATPPRRRVYLGALGQVRAELTEALGGRPARTCWIHGDFWPGNLLASGPAVTGVVDWDRASASQLPLHDLLHLHVLSRRLATGDELGEVVVRALRESLSAAIGVPAGRLAAWLDGIPERPAVLLYWLRHVSLFIDSEGHRDNPRWLRGNVERVLARA
jgi:aminoglycoside phosphotransferase (APT) family kinase protein